jgi:hypothetical protein
MSWLQEWKALRVRAESLALAAQEFVSILSHKDDDGLSLVRKVIVPTGTNVCADLKAFNKKHEAALPSGARTALDRVALLTFYAEGDNHKHINLQLASVLRAIVSEVDFYLSDHEAAARSTVEWSFLHLRRRLAVDKDLRDRWRAEFLESGEVRIEKLGALHLLGDGVYGFKAVGAGAATDLILGTAIGADDPDLINARVLALTEWKAVRSPAEVAAQAEDARRQARQYSAGLLAGTELQRTRYIVLVSETELVMPTDVQEGAVLYRHVGIAIEAPTPSKSRA